jgi:SAM-dependent methyltransferase
LNPRPSAAAIAEPPVAGPLRTLFYDAGEPSATPGEIAWYLERLPDCVGPILDLACGFGRLLVPLIAAGRKIHGVDASAPMLASCEARLATAKSSSFLFRQDAWELNLPFRYAAAYASAGALQMMTDPARVRVALERVRAHLVPPGVLLLEMFVPSDGTQRLAAPLVEVRTARLPDGTQIAQRSETTVFAEARLAHIESRYVHRRGNTRLAEEHEARRLTWYAPEDAVALVADAGYCDIAVEPPPRTFGDGTTFALRARA